MAFMGLMFVGIVLAILCGLVILAVVLFIISCFVRKKHRRAARILRVLAGICVLLPVGVVIVVMMPKPKTVETAMGEVKLAPSWISKYEKYLENDDVEGMRELFEKHPEMIYYYDVNRVTLLDYGMYNLNVELMQIAIENGAVFDDPLTYEHLVFHNSFHSFLSRLGYPKGKGEDPVRGVTTEAMLETVAFMIENGASLEYGNVSETGHVRDYSNFYEQATAWVKEDGTVSDLDEQLLVLIEENMR